MNTKKFYLLLTITILIVFSLAVLTYLNFKNSEKINSNINKIELDLKMKSDSISFLKDSLFIVNLQNLDLKKENLLLNDSIKIIKDLLKSKATYQMTYRDFDARFKLAKINRYVKIVENRPSNQKFFFGWIRRTVKE